VRRRRRDRLSERRDHEAAGFIGLIGAAAYSMSWPFAAPAQQAMPVLGWLSSGTPELSTLGLNAFRAGLKEGSYEEGRNVAIEYRWADGYDRLKAMAG
jgi:putative tryptophan/tyrosine transport system substrate-binding protein